MSRSDREYLDHVLDEIDYLAAEAPALSLDVWDVVARKMSELRPSIVKLIGRIR